jgi:hypothetical protein
VTPAPQRGKSAAFFKMKHNQSQADEVQALIERERWYLSERLGYDCTKTPYGICALNHRVAMTITRGFNQFLNTINNDNE